jgi:hypothetical protein
MADPPIMVLSAGGIEGALLASKRSAVVPDTTNCLWQASLLTWTATVLLLLRQRRYGFYVPDRLDGERDGVAETNGVEYQTILHLEVLRGFSRCRRPEADADTVVSLVHARDDAPERQVDRAGRHKRGDECE